MNQKEINMTKNAKIIYYGLHGLVIFCYVIVVFIGIFALLGYAHERTWDAAFHKITKDLEKVWIDKDGKLPLTDWI
jgi:quinol-cytochrome oxidoreductase complex cytochrome b subunit